MGQSAQYLSMVAGVVILFYGITKLFEQDYIPFILGLLIVAFTLSKMVKSRTGKGTSFNGRK
jgi:type III secretory pathway component EscS